MRDDTDRKQDVCTWVATGVVALTLASGDVLADTDIVTTSSNPIGDLIQVQLQYQYSPNTYGLDGNSSVGIIQPVIPIDLPFKSAPKMITRTTIPYVSTPDLPGVGSKSGIGDTLFLGAVLPNLGLKRQMLGVGPALGLPTATSDHLGSEKWTAGPLVVYVNLQTKGWLWGVLSYGLFDFAGNSDRDGVSQYAVQPVLNKFFGDGWFLALQDVVWTYDDKTDKWDLPTGPRLGKVVYFGKQAVSIFGGAYYNPENVTGNAEWSFKVSFSLLLPK